jgi:nicotinamidase-related amidase
MRVRAMWVCVALGVLVAVCAAPAHGAAEAMPELRPVLLVVDVQNIWLPHMSEEDRASAPDKINEIIGLFREFDYPVIRVYHSDPERGPEVDTEPFEFPASIAINDDDLRIVKAEPSSFTRTELENVLLARDRNAVFLCGLSATGCVLATYYGALDRDFMVLMVEDAILSPNASYTDVIEDISYSMTIEEIRETFEEKDK